MVIDEIIRLEKIEASEEEVENEYKALAKIDLEADEKAAAQKLAEVKKQYPAHQVAYKVRADKVVLFLKENMAKNTKEKGEATEQNGEAKPASAKKTSTKKAAQ